MKAYAVYSEHTCKFIDIPNPEPGPYDALVKILACGVCNGTDSKIIHGKFKGIDNYPVVLGHEGVGRVEKTGEKVKNYAPGDIVIMPYHANTPENIYSAWGTFSKYNTVTDAAAMKDDGLVPDAFAWGQQKLPADIDPASAVMILTFREVLSTMKLFGFESNKSLAVLGLGPVSQSFIRFAKLTGMGPIIAIGRNDEQIGDAIKHGADHIVDVRTENIEESIRKICPDGVDFALDAAGSTDFINTGLGIIKPDAKICVYGISETMNADINWSRCPYNWTLQFNQFPSKIAESEALSQITAWIECGALDPMDFICKTLPFEQIDEAYRMVEAHEARKKIVITL